MTDALIFNAVIIVLASVVVALFLPGGDVFERFVGALGAAWLVTCVSGVIWVIYIAQHFAVKYW
jgi:hypothetical protein